MKAFKSSTFLSKLTPVTESNRRRFGVAVEPNLKGKLENVTQANSKPDSRSAGSGNETECSSDSGNRISRFFLDTRCSFFE